MKLGSSITTEALRGAKGYVLIRFSLGTPIKNIPYIQQKLEEKYPCVTGLSVYTIKCAIYFMGNDEEVITITDDFLLKDGLNEYEYCKFHLINSVIKEVRVEVSSFIVRGKMILPIKGILADQYNYKETLNKLKGKRFPYQDLLQSDMSYFTTLEAWIDKMKLPAWLLSSKPKPLKAIVMPIDIESLQDWLEEECGCVEEVGGIIHNKPLPYYPHPPLYKRRYK